MAGGITYSELESVNVYLGKGNNTFTIESTSAATNTVDTGGGNDTVYVETISGHTTVDTRGGADIVDVSAAGQVARIAGLLTVDMGGDTGDTLLVDDSADPNDSTGTLTGTTLTGLGMPTVAEEETLTVTAGSGSYELFATGYGQITVQYGESVATLEAQLDGLFHLDNVHVALASSTSTQTSYTILFLGDGAGVHFPQLQWVRTWTLTPTGPVLSAPGFGDGSVGSGTADEIRSALEHVYGVSAFTVLAGTAPGTFEVTIGGAYVALELSQLVGATATPETSLVPTLDATASVNATIVADGTTTPGLNNVQTISADGTGSYLIHFVLANSQGALLDYVTGPIQAGSSAADVLAALSAILNPNNTNPALPFTNNVTVEKHGTSFTITFQGAYAGIRIAYVSGAATIATRTSGIDYYGVDQLDIELGSGDDVFNVQGTAAHTATQLDTNDGVDHVYVSSEET
jgi:hypothetical protein